jgi:hypothetical protein
MRAFEIHTFQGGKWKIDSVFDDRQLAMFEAKRMDGSNRYAGVRVVEEIFDESSKRAITKTIFRGGRANAVLERGPPPPVQKRARRPGAQRGGVGQDRRRKGRRHPAQSGESGIAKPLILLFVVTLCGIAAMVGLQYLQKLT